MAKEKKDTNKIKLVKKSKFLLLRVFCDDEYFCDCNNAVIEITDEMIKGLTALKSVMKIMDGGGRKESKPAELYRMSYWSPSWEARFLHNDDVPEEITENSYDDYDFHYLNKIIEPNYERDFKCDVGLMHIYSEGVRFDCRVNGTTINLETALIPFEDLGIK